MKRTKQILSVLSVFALAATAALSVHAEDTTPILWVDEHDTETGEIIEAYGLSTNGFLGVSGIKKEVEDMTVHYVHTTAGTAENHAFVQNAQNLSGSAKRISGGIFLTDLAGETIYWDDYTSNVAIVNNNNVLTVSNTVSESDYASGPYHIWYQSNLFAGTVQQAPVYNYVQLQEVLIVD